MTLYLYNTENPSQKLCLSQVASYTDQQVILENGTSYEPLAPGWELSREQDCSETLRADWLAEHPTQDARLDELEDLMAELLFGGESA